MDVHRMPLQKLAFLALFKLSGQDFRAAAFFNVIALGLVAFALIRAARRLRGRTVYADAFFPLLLLNWTQAHNLLVGFQLQFILSTVLAYAVLLVLVQRPAPLTFGSTLVIGVCLLLLPLCGANGLVYVPALACWLAYAGILACRSSDLRQRQIGGLAVAMAAAALLIIPAYLSGLGPASEQSAVSERLGPALMSTAQFLSMGFAKGHGRMWPFAAMIVGGLVLASAGLLAWAAWHKPLPERSRALGLLAFLTATVCLAGSVGWGRVNIGGLQSRYVTLVTPLLCCVYFAWELYGGSARRRSVQTVLLVIMILLVPLDLRAGWGLAQKVVDDRQALQRDLVAGVPVFALADRHRPRMPELEEVDTRMPENMRALHQTGVGPFRSLQLDPPFRAVPIDPQPTEVSGMTWEAGVAQSSGPDSYLVISLPSPRFVHGIQLRYTYLAREEGSYRLRLGWELKGQHSLPETHQEVRKGWDHEGTVRAWVNGTIDQFRVYPDSRPCTIRITEIVLLVPEAGPHVVSNP
jgi:hypothetical protein